MKSPASKMALLLAATLAFGAAPANAQTTTDGTSGNTQTVSNDGQTVTTRTTRTEDHHFPWALLGLIGLAGLLPKRRREPDIHVDARSDTTR